jgi:hypothetical protein
LEVGSPFLPRPTWTVILLFHASHYYQVIGACHYTIEMVSCKLLLLGLAWNHDPPDLSLLGSLGWQVCASAPSYWLRWKLAKFFPGLGLELWATSNLSLICYLYQVFFWEGVVLEFELRALHLLSRHSTIWATYTFSPLFSKVTRTERQLIAIKAWKSSGLLNSNLGPIFEITVFCLSHGTVTLFSCPALWGKVAWNFEILSNASLNTKFHA